MSSRLVLIALLAACGSSVPAVTAPAPPPSHDTSPPAVADAAAKPPARAALPTKVREIEGITEYRLDNGLQLLVFPDPTQSTVTVNVTYLVGSRLEGYGETGMAHLLEHMMFKGSPKYRNVLKLVGDRGGIANGSTLYDRTNYFETLPATQDNLDWALDLEADRMVHAEISPDDLKTEFSVVRNEFEQDENRAEGILGERIDESAFIWHNYGKPTIGSRVDIERVPVPALRAFYEKFYQPDDAVLIVSGKVDPAGVLDAVARTFGALPKPTRVLPATYTIEPVQDGQRTVELRRTGDVHIVELAYHVVASSSPDFPAVEAALDILGRQPTGRLYKKLVEPKLAATIDVSAQPLRDPYLAEVTATVRDAKNVDRVEQTMIADVEGLGATKIDERDLERWRTATLKELELSMNDSSQLAIALSEYAAEGDWRTLFAYRDHIKKVTVADVARVASTYFKPSNRTIGRFIPTTDPSRAPLTETPNVADIVKGIESGDVKDKGEGFVASLENIEARTQRGALKSGLKTALLAKKTRGGRVELVLQLHWGNEAALQNKETIGSLMAELMARGTTKKSFQEIGDLEDKLKTHLTFEGTADGVTVQLDTERDQLAGAIALLAEILRSPAFADKELAVLREERLAGLERELKDPNAIAGIALEQLANKWPKSDPRYIATPAESIADVKRVTAGDIRQFYRDFASGEHGELAVVGDFVPADVTAAFDAMLTGWTSKKPYARLANKLWDVPGSQKSIDIKDKEQTAVAFGEAFAMRDTSPDFAPLEMMSRILGGDAGSRMWMRLREHEGLSYGVGCQVAASAFDDVGWFGGFAIVAPQNLSKAKASLVDEIQNIANGVDDKELQRVKAAWSKELDTYLSDDAVVTALLARQAFRGRTMEFSAQQRTKVNAVTTADVQRVAKQFLLPGKLLLVDAGDVAKSK